MSDSGISSPYASLVLCRFSLRSPKTNCNFACMFRGLSRFGAHYAMQAVVIDNQNRCAICQTFAFSPRSVRNHCHLDKLRVCSVMHLPVDWRHDDRHDDAVSCSSQCCRCGSQNDVLVQTAVTTITGQEIKKRRHTTTKTTATTTTLLPICQVAVLN